MCAALRRCCPPRPRPLPNPDRCEDRSMSRPDRRYFRTILIGTVSLAALVWMAVKRFGVSREEILELLLASGLVVLAVIVLAGSTAALWVWLRRLLRGRRSK